MIANENYAAAPTVYAEGQFAGIAQCVPNEIMPFGWGKQQQKTAPARTKELASLGTQFPRLLVPSVYRVGGDSEPERAFEFPAFMQQTREFVQPAATAECKAHF